MALADTDRPPCQSSDWQALWLRSTFFPAQAVTDFVCHHWWEGIFGVQPESHTENSKKRVIEDVGEVMGQKLLLVGQPARIDMRLVPVEDEAIEVGVQAAGPVTDFLAEFVEYSQKLVQLDTFPLPGRLALAGELAIETGSRDEALGILVRLLPNVNIEPEITENLLYQINRPRRSSAVPSGVWINRLAKWSYARMLLDVSMIAPNTPLAQLPRQELHACRMTFDINTSIEHAQPVPKADAARLLGEFRGLAEELMEKGDVR